MTGNSHTPDPAESADEADNGVEITDQRILETLALLEDVDELSAEDEKAVFDTVLESLTKQLHSPQTP